MSASAVTTLTIDELRVRREQLTLVDVRSPGEFASGHVPGAYNIPLDQLERALPDLRKASGAGELAFVCASGNRSRSACELLAADGIPAATVDGGTSAWTQAGNPVDRDAEARPVWAMDRQVRLVAGSTVLAGLAAGLAWPRARWLSAGMAAGLVYSAVSNTCAMATLLGQLPYNRRGAEAYDLDSVLTALQNR